MGRQKISNKLEQEIVNLYTNERYSTRNISNTLHVGTTTVTRVLLRNNCKIRTQSESQIGVGTGTTLPVEYILKLYSNGSSANKIAAEIGCSKTSILNVLRHNDVKKRTYSDYTYIRPHKFEHDIIKLYTSGLSYHEIGKQLNIPWNTIQYTIAKHNLIRDEVEQKKVWYRVVTGMEYEKFMEKIPIYRRYKTQVNKYTNRQNLKSLLHYDKRGKGGYHLDHKYSVMEGFKNNINPEIIGNIHNLEMLPYDENISKHDKCSITIDELMALIGNKISIYLI